MGERKRGLQHCGTKHPSAFHRSSSFYYLLEVAHGR